MSEVKSPYVAGGVVLLGIVAVLAGVARRNAVDLGSTGPSLAGLVASTEKIQDVPESAYYEQLSNLLKSEYVDPISDDGKLADGAVRGMVMSLQDPKALYLSVEERLAYENAQAGKFEGIGVFLTLELPKIPKADPKDLALKVPKLVVTEVVPDGPAGKAGVKVGDVVYSVDGHWLVSSEDIANFRGVQEKVDKKQLPPEAILKARSELRKKTEKSLLPTKAFDKLFLGKEGVANVVWKRGGQTFATNLTKAESSLSGFRFTGDAGAKLAEMVKAGPVQLDLRNNASGDPSAAIAALSSVMPKASVGRIISPRGKAETVTINGGPEAKLTVLVDGTTRGAAAIFAQALASKKPAAVQGKTSSDLIVVTLVKLDNGTGYTLPTGEFKAGAGK